MISSGDMICVGSAEGYDFSITDSKTIGRIVERVKNVAESMQLSLEERDQSNGTKYRVLFDQTTHDHGFEALEQSVKADINGYSTTLFKIVGAIDRARKRHSWLEELGQQNKSDCTSLAQADQAPESSHSEPHQSGAAASAGRPRTDVRRQSVTAIVEDIMSDDT